MKILLTGATGYIGRRLKEKLLQDPEVQLRLFVRNEKKVRGQFRAQMEISEGSTFDKKSLGNALRGIEVAYYLIHSMGAKGDFKKLDRLSAEYFLNACIQADVQKIIYLGGLGIKDTASKHLLSRIETGEILSSRPESIQTIWFRAGTIIGSGSASFEIIRNIVQKLPVILAPKWIRTKTQPIGITDVLEYLFQAKDLETKENLKVDIGSEQMSFRDLLLKASKVMGLKRLMIPVPLMTPNFSSYGLIFISPIPYSIARALVQGLKSETVIQNQNAAKFFPEIQPEAYEKAVARAISEIEHNQVISHWCDSSSQEQCDVKGKDRITGTVSTFQISRDLNHISGEKVYESALTVGGAHGWFQHNWLWRLRGFIDKILGGPGLNRGRRNPVELRIGDSLDFWKVVDLKKGRRVLLFAQMKLPGKAWLEFSIQKNKLIQTSYFLPKGLWGRVYWGLTLPFHALVFKALANGILKKAQSL
ncbi:MAG: DUF2867 domain-containing protein [Candidatus Aminicenantes bacterium]|nr:DUF2867 domain-containing protein [Candidatus Aminicenantes bacterium]